MRVLSGRAAPARSGGHGGEIAGYATVAFSSRDAARQLVLMDNLLPAPGGAVQAAVEHALSQGLSC